ncbi:MAG: AMP-binding protein, partial [Petrimonas mucosa]|uniref:AMP-binding protein n=2 Tax=Dysgonomonadaceae TaxID=2005520 RepID=UPI003D91D8C5
MIQQNFIKIYEESFKSNWELPALSNYKDRKTLSYSQLAEKIARIHIMYEELGIRKGDKVALIGKNHTGWSLVFLATITYGAVIVPILHEFNPESIEHIISHSESRCVFINKKIWENLDKNKVTVPVFSLPSFDLLQSHDETTKELPIKLDALFAKKYPDGFHKENI